MSVSNILILIIFSSRSRNLMIFMYIYNLFYSVAVLAQSHLYNPFHVEPET